jgi:hypothetical protein
MRRLFTVTNRFNVKGRGVVLLPGLKPIDEKRFQVGDAIRLKRPDGVELTVPIAGLELPHPNPKYECLVLLHELDQEDVPIGTEVWSVEEEPR